MEMTQMLFIPGCNWWS